MESVDFASLSSKGQIVIPSPIRRDLDLSAGQKLLVYTDGTHIVLKPIGMPDVRTFRAAVREARRAERSLRSTEAWKARKGGSR
jgi:AbrB family looped-hinge helix DNA binding protein